MRVPEPSPGRHRRRGDDLPGRSTLLAILATLTVLLGSGAAVTLTAAQLPPEPATGVGTIGVAPSPWSPSTTDRSASGAQALSPSPTPTAPPTTEPPPPPPDPPAQEHTDEITALENQVTALTNAERAAVGCGQLRTDERLRTAARGHSQDMADNDYFSHTGLDGSSPTDRARAAGYSGGVAENIAMGYRTPEDVMRGWMNSDGHRNNLLNCNHRVIGVGLAYDSRGRAYWTQNFGRG
jgi:uncharacterized protein YkwD